MGSPSPHRPHGATVSPPGNKPRPRPPSGSSSTQPPNNHTPPPASRRPRLGPALSALACPTLGCVRTPPQPLGCHRWVPPTPQSSSPPFAPTPFFPSGLCSGSAPARGPAPETPPPRAETSPCRRSPRVPAPIRSSRTPPPPPPPSPAPTRGPPSTRGGGSERSWQSGRSRPLVAAAAR